MTPIIVRYWDIRGLVQPIRLLLDYAGADLEDKLYTIGPAPEYDRSAWLSEKKKLGLAFPNLPCLKDGDVKLTQSEAILRYVARNFKMEGQADEEKYLVDMVVAEMTDIKRSFGTLCYSPDFASLKENFLKKIQVKLAAWI